MIKNFKYTNTVVFGFDDIDDPKRKELTDMLSQGVADDWVLHTSTYNALGNKGVEIGDMFRDINKGSSIRVVEVGFSFENSKPFAVCADYNISLHHLFIKYFDELLNAKVWAKMGQNTKGEGDDNAD